MTARDVIASVVARDAFTAADSILQALQEAGYVVAKGPVFDFGRNPSIEEEYMIACLNLAGYTVSKPNPS